MRSPFLVCSTCLGWLLLLGWTAGCTDPGPADDSATTPTDTVLDSAETTDSGWSATRSSHVLVLETAEVGPLTVDISVELDGGFELVVLCTRSDDPEEVHLAESALSATHRLRLAGLRGATTYRCALASPDTPTLSARWTFETSPVPGYVPEVSVSTHAELEPTGAWTLLNHQAGCEDDARQRLLLFDPVGDVRWYHDLPETLTAGIEARHHGDGVFVWGGGNHPDGAPRIIDLMGQELYRTVFEGSEAEYFHHDGKQLDDGRIMTLTWGTDRQGESEWTGFRVQVHEPSTGELQWTWGSQDGVDAGVLPSGEGDAYHANWIDLYDHGRGPTAYVSLCKIDQIIAIDEASSEVAWRLGVGGDFALQDLDGQPLGDERWPGCQHGPEVTHGGERLLVYDNGRGRGRSRVVEYGLDTGAMIATELWSWDDDWWEYYMGDVDALSEDRVLVTRSHFACPVDETARVTDIVEIDRPSGETVWRLAFGSPEDEVYRSERLGGCELFANAKWCDEVAARVEGGVM